MSSRERKYDDESVCKFYICGLAGRWACVPRCGSAAGVRARCACRLRAAAPARITHALLLPPPPALRRRFCPYEEFRRTKNDYGYDCPNVGGAPGVRAQRRAAARQSQAGAAAASWSAGAPTDGAPVLHWSTPACCITLLQVHDDNCHKQWEALDDRSKERYG